MSACIKLQISDGALKTVPIFNHELYGKNWLCVLLARDKRAPGGFQRRFCERAGSPYYYLIAGLEPGDAIEFGADQCIKNPRNGRKIAVRAYGVIDRITKRVFSYRPWPTAVQALIHSRNPLGRGEAQSSEPVQVGYPAARKIRE